MVVQLVFDGPMGTNVEFDRVDQFLQTSHSYNNSGKTSVVIRTQNRNSVFSCSKSDNPFQTPKEDKRVMIDDQ